MTNNQQMNFKYIFGPVPSRRLGRSLGVDLVPHKTCTLNCVYCECGKTTCLTLKRNRLIPATEWKNELNAVLSQHPKLDHITF
ncbi:radical SAM protein, partial [Thermodesulfobacteriota bacterium]